MGPATKRRKLEHDSDASSEVETSLIEEYANGASTSDHDESDTNDMSMEDLDANDDDDDDDVSDHESISEEEEQVVKSKANDSAQKKAKNTAQPKHAEKASLPRPSDVQLSGGVYTAETFKSNVFKLQVDEILENVKLNYGKKEALAENAMRTVKAIIEQLPSREPQSVRCHNYSRTLP